MVLSHTVTPQNSLSNAAARSKDQLAPARHNRRWAWGLTKPVTPNRSSKGNRVVPQRGQARYNRRNCTTPTAVTIWRVVCPLGQAAFVQSGQRRAGAPFFRRSWLGLARWLRRLGG